MLRFFNPGHPARRFEFFTVMLLLLGSLAVSVLFVIEFSVDFEAESTSYNALNLTLFWCHWLLTATLAAITISRRVNDFGADGLWTAPALLPVAIVPIVPFILEQLFGRVSIDVVQGFVVGIPVTQLAIVGLLSIRQPKSRATVAPFGDNPNDPGSWLNPAEVSTDMSEAFNHEPGRAA